MVSLLRQLFLVLNVSLRLHAIFEPVSFVSCPLAFSRSLLVFLLSWAATVALLLLSLRPWQTKGQRRCSD